MSTHRRAHRPAVMGTHGMVASAHPLASAAGLEMLWRGGSAVDAVVAVAAALNVVEPFMSGIGGDGLLLLSLGRSGERKVLDFMGRTPLAARPADCTAADLERGPKSCLVPGNFAGWWEALRAHGRLQPEVVFAPAIRYAEEGFPLTHRGLLGRPPRAAGSRGYFGLLPGRRGAASRHAPLTPGARHDAPVAGRQGARAAVPGRAGPAALRRRAGGGRMALARGPRRVSTRVDRADRLNLPRR